MVGLIGTAFSGCFSRLRKRKNGKWESVDIRIAPGVEGEGFSEISKVLHIKKDETEGCYWYYL